MILTIKNDNFTLSDDKNKDCINLPLLFTYTNAYYIGKFASREEFDNFIRENKTKLGLVFDKNGHIILFKRRQKPPQHVTKLAVGKNGFWQAYGSAWTDRNGQEVHGWDFKRNTFIRVAIENKEVLSTLFNTTVDKLYDIEPLKLKINED
jgi:hypothetical protein